MALTPSVKINRVALDFLLKDPAGPVQRDMLRRATNVLAAAQLRCPKHLGALEASLRIETFIENGGPVYNIGSHLPYAVFVDQGTGPLAGHAKYSKMPPIENLREWADDNGVNVFRLARAIFNHGTAPTYFLSSALAEAAI